MTPLQIPWRTKCVRHTMNIVESRKSRIFNSNSHYFGFEFRFSVCVCAVMCSALASSSIFVEMCGKKHFDFGKAWKGNNKGERKNHASRPTATVLAAAATLHTIQPTAHHHQQQQNDDNRQILNLHGNFIRGEKNREWFFEWANRQWGNESMKSERK